MPYDTLKALPASVRDHLPRHAQEIYFKAFNNAWWEYRHASKRRQAVSREQTAYRVAWAAVAKAYKKDERSGKWRRRRAQAQ